MRNPFIVTIVATLIVPFIITGQNPTENEINIAPKLPIAVKHLALPSLAKAPDGQIDQLSPVTQPPAPQTVVGTSSAMQFIFQHESGGRLDAVNEIGACGIGQSLPCSKLSSVCPNWRTDGDCQIRFFTNYAVGRYGSWENAQSWWLSHNWW